MEFSWKHAIAVVFNLVALVLLWQKRYHINYRDRIARLKREIMFSTIGRRPRGSTNKSYPAVGSVVVLLCGNIFSLVYRTHGKAQLAGRASRLALINFVVVLALGSGRNVIFNSWARFGYQELGVIHRWLARMFLLHAIVHIFCHATAHGRLNRSQGLLVTSVGLLAITSFLYFRRQRWLYEVFKTSHAVLIVLLIVQTWFHILNKKNVTAIVLTAIISVLWLGTFILWAAFLQSRNGSLSGSPISSLERLEDRNDAKLYRVKIALSLQRTIAPGQYFYLVHRKWFFFQSHPYMVAWEEKEGDKQYVYFLVERRKGFSAWLQAQMPSKEPSKEPSVYMDGPYGGHIHLRNYDSVLFVSRGIGVASQILLIRDLLEAHDGKEARVRRVTLLWVDCDMLYEMVEEFLLKLLNIPKEGITLNISCCAKDISRFTAGEYLHFLKDSPDIKVLTQKESEAEAVKAPDEAKFLGIKAEIQKECGVEAGNKVVNVCGDPGFEQEVRSAIKETKTDIHLLYSDFLPDQ